MQSQRPTLILFKTDNWSAHTTYSSARYSTHRQRKKRAPQIVLLTSFYRHDAQNILAYQVPAAIATQLVQKPNDLPAELILITFFSVLKHPLLAPYQYHSDLLCRLPLPSTCAEHDSVLQFHLPCGRHFSLRNSSERFPE